MITIARTTRHILITVNGIVAAIIPATTDRAGLAQAIATMDPFQR